MKLSEAIRLGAMMGPQVYGNYVAEGGGSCALGAAMKAAGIRKLNSLNCDQMWPWGAGALHICPESHCMARADVTGLILHLNDDHYWTRERIADWVATIEPEEVHAPETNGQCSLGKGPIGPSLEEVTAVTITI